MGQANTTALTLIARQSGADTDMNVKDNRIRLQRVIYLAQAAGMPKIYTFRWFNNGPMSTRLSGDIEDMRYTNGDAPDNPTSKRLRKSARAAVSTARSVLTPPPDLKARRTEWEKVVTYAMYMYDIGSSRRTAEICGTEAAELVPAAMLKLRTNGMLYD